VIFLKLISDQKASDYLHDLKRSFDSRWNWGQERYIGRIMGRFFSVTYYSGREFGGRYPVFNKAIGFVKDTEGRTQVFLVSFIGLTDPFSLLSMFLAAYVIFLVKTAPSPFLLSLIWTLAASFFTFVMTFFSVTGLDGHEKLIRFLKDNG
jgi:hypothetical protein